MIVPIMEFPLLLALDRGAGGTAKTQEISVAQAVAQRQRRTCRGQLNQPLSVKEHPARGVAVASAQQAVAQRVGEGKLQFGGISCPTSSGEIGYQRGQRRLYSAGKRRV